MAVTLHFVGPGGETPPGHPTLPCQSPTTSGMPIAKISTQLRSSLTSDIGLNINRGAQLHPSARDRVGPIPEAVAPLRRERPIQLRAQSATLFQTQPLNSRIDGQFRKFSH